MINFKKIFIFIKIICRSEIIETIGNFLSIFIALQHANKSKIKKFIETLITINMKTICWFESPWNRQKSIFRSFNGIKNEKILLCVLRLFFFLLKITFYFLWVPSRPKNKCCWHIRPFHLKSFFSSSSSSPIVSCLCFAFALIQICAGIKSSTQYSDHIDINIKSDLWCIVCSIRFFSLPLHISLHLITEI